MYIYKILNNINGKIYIGKTEKSIEDRWKKHLLCVKNKVNRYLYDAMNKYGIDNFSISEIEKCNSREELNEREKYWIKLYNSINKDFGYNMQEGGLGGKQPQDIIDRVRLKKKGFRHSETTKLKMSTSKKGKHNHFQSNDTKKKLSIIVKNLWSKGILNSRNNSMRGKVGKEHHFYGRHHTLESKKKMSELKLGKTTSIKQKEVARNNFLGSKNPRYKNVDKELLYKLLLNNKTTKELSAILKVSEPTIISKTKLYFNCLPSKFKNL